MSDVRERVYRAGVCQQGRGAKRCLGPFLLIKAVWEAEPSPSPIHPTQHSKVVQSKQRNDGMCWNGRLRFISQGFQRCVQTKTKKLEKHSESKESFK